MESLEHQDLLVHKVAEACQVCQVSQDLKDTGVFPVWMELREMWEDLV